ncbi:MAG: peptide chain release factor 1 [Candidatus Aenigmarchaeota archaeon]|nr:peptide chain release factor 1 [Candidatus Aenigmarchaeota archaeon]
MNETKKSSQLNELETRASELEKKLQDKEIINQPPLLMQLSKEYGQIKMELTQKKELIKINQDISSAQEILDKETDPELLALAQEDLDNLKQQKNKLSRSEQIINQSKNIIIEIRAGTGGDEAALFAADLFRMYNHFAEQKKWTVHLIDANRTSLQGFKEVIFSIHGTNTYQLLKNESGVHRVQRIPETEKSGRIHTSTATVAVLIEAKPTDISISPNDLRIDTYRASGHGGQSVQKNSSAVRITYLPTNVVVACQDERSQKQNKERAMTVLRSRLLTQQQEEKATKMKETRRGQIGQAKRSEKIRTYNFPQNRITDHRLQKSWYNLSEVLNGNLDKIINTLNDDNDD